MSWDELVLHPYITEADERIQKGDVDNSELHMSFDQKTGHYRMEDSVFGIE